MYTNLLTSKIKIIYNFLFILELIIKNLESLF